MRLRNTILTGAASYLQMGSLMVTQLVAIPMVLPTDPEIWTLIGR